MLEDLDKLIKSCREKFNSYGNTDDIHLTEELSIIISNELKKTEKKYTFVVNPFSIILTNEHKLRADIPSSWLWYGAAFHPLYTALNEYHSIRTKIKAGLKNKGYNAKQIEAYLKTLPSDSYKTKGDQIETDFVNLVSTLVPASDRPFFEKLLTDRTWWYQPLHETEQKSGKKLDRSDAFEASLQLATGLIVANAAKIALITQIFAGSDELQTKFNELSISSVSFADDLLSKSTVPTEDVSLPKDISGKNIIYYGAPGTGKSHSIEESTTSENSVRTVFHPETQHNDFVGCLKPAMNEDKIVYAFRPGPFSLALVKASKNINKPTYLLIEEINRGAAAAIFGDLFLLLDRDCGRSEYTIDISDPDMKAYLEKNAKNVLDPNGKLFIPSNLSIMATMNSSDQAVMPMDSAFKRRWEFEYIPLVGDAYPKGNLHINIPSGKIEISWESFSTIINERLAVNQHIPEDRLLGPWFLSEKEMIDEPTAKKSLASKILMYLFDDVLRHGNKSDIFNECGQGNFGTLITAFNANESIFESTLSDQFESVKVKNAE